jgi:aminomethyltransferase
MPLPTPFHSRTARLCESHDWRDWSGYLAASLYEPSHEREYYAVRNSAALIDVSPLFKYDIVGPDALRAVNRIVTRDMNRCRVGQIFYTGWCDEAGKLIDDGTVWRLSEHHFRITAADPNWRWFKDCAFGLDAEVHDMSDRLAALALQGPQARRILQQLAVEGVDLDSLAYYCLQSGRLKGFPLTISRTGFTGDLGYELWLEPDYAEMVWDRLTAVGRDYGLLPAGMVALDIARIEAGLLLADVDYVSSHKALIEMRKSSPYELGLGWTVALDKGPFIGRDALRREWAAGAAWALVGLEIAWAPLEELYARVDLPPQVAGRASRLAVPVYRYGRQVGQMTSSTFSPILKKYIGLASVEALHAAPGTELEVEVTVEYRRQPAPARVVPLPFFDPPRKRQ